MSLTDDDVHLAEDRLRRRLAAEPQATAAQFDRSRNRIIVILSNRLEISVPVDLVQGLAGASAADLEIIEISPTGLGLNWLHLMQICTCPGFSRAS